MTNTDYVKRYLGNWVNTGSSNRDIRDGWTWTVAGDFSKSNIESSLKYIYKIYDELDPERTRYNTTRSTPKRQSLPDIYPKGNLDDLLGVNSEV